MNLPSLPRTEKTYKSDFWPTVIRYKAFTAGQQTLLLQVADASTPFDERTATMEQLFASTVEAGVPFNRIPVGVVEEIFIRMRCISIGEQMKIKYKCNAQLTDSETNEKTTCSQELVLPIPLDNVKCRAIEGFKEAFDLPGGYHLKMRQPTFSDVQLLSDTVSVQAMIATFIDCLYDDDGQVWRIENPNEPGIPPEVAVQRMEVRENFIQWVGDNIESEVIQDIAQNFFQKIPRIHYESKIKCPACGTEHPIAFNSLQEIFI